MSPRSPNITPTLPFRQQSTRGVHALELLTILAVLFNLLILFPLQIYGLIRGINLQRYNLGIAKGRRYKQGFWWRQAVGLARSRARKGANFIVTSVLAALGVVFAFINGSWIDSALCSYILINALVAANFFATQLPLIEAEQGTTSTAQSTSASEVGP